jgi:hypothetical protein
MIEIQKYMIPSLFLRKAIRISKRGGLPGAQQVKQDELTGA